MFIKLLLISYIFSGNVMSSDEASFKIDQSSMKSIQEIMPEAVMVDRIAYHHNESVRKQIGPRFIDNYRINVDVLIPKMIKIMQDQQAEIEKLKGQKALSCN